MTDHRLAPAADRTVTAGDNQAPDDVFTAQLEEDLASLIERQGDLEIEAAGLPEEVASDEDVAAITAHVVKRRALARDVEKERVERNRPILDMQKKLNAFCNAISLGLKNRADEIEQRSRPYLLAKQQREQAAAAERARLAKEAADRAAQAIKDAADKAAADKLAAEAEAKRLADAEAERVNRETLAQQESERDEAPVALDADHGQEADRAEESFRQAAATASQSSLALEQAHADAAKAALDSAKADKVAAGGQNLGRAGSDAGTARVKMVWRARVIDADALTASLGPLGVFLTGANIDALVQRAGASADRPACPGLEYYEEADVSTSAKRS